MTAKVSTIAFGGQMTAMQTLLNAQEAHQHHDFRRVCVVAVDVDGDIHLAASSGSGLEIVGMLQVAADSVISDMAFRSMQKGDPGPGSG